MRLTIIGTMGVSTGTKYILVVNSSDKLLLIMNYEETTSLGPDSKYKVVFLGDSAVGKTSIVERIAYGKYDDAHSVTPHLLRLRLFWIPSGRMSSTKTGTSSCCCGIQLASKNTTA